MWGAMDQASQVREKIDIVSLISEYLKLKKMGRNFTTICPFHSENTPSFVVSPERQIWHCFGCGKGGDAFSFLMEYESLEFIEALRILAKKAGVTLKLADTSATSSKKEKIYSLNKIASSFYNYILLNHPMGKAALEYLMKKRGLSQNLIKTFNIGFAPPGRNSLSNYLINKKKNNPWDLIEAGLVFKKDENIFDFFRERIIFPLVDHRGNIVGFSGRHITENGFGPKYINTKDTLVYHKGSMFFGLNAAKEEIKKQGIAIVMEGEFDVISAFSQGIKNTVALKGTALTEQQALLLSRFATKVSLCLDKDEAGLIALKRSIPVLEKRGLSITVVAFDGKDPDDAIKKSPASFKKSLKNDVDVYDFLIGKLSKENDASSVSGKKKISDEILPLISAVQNEVVKEHYLKKLSQVIDTSYESLMTQLYKKEEDRTEKVFSKIQIKDRREILEEYLMSLILQNNSENNLFINSKDILTPYEFKILSLGKIFIELSSFFKKSKGLNINTFSKNLPKELIPAYDKCFLIPLPKFESSEKLEAEVLKVSKELKIFYLKERIGRIGISLKGEKTSLSDIEKIRDEIAKITSQL